MFDLGISLRPATLDDRERIYAWMTAPGIVESMLGPPVFPDCAVPSRETFLSDWEPHYFTHAAPDQGRAFVIQRASQDVGMIAHSDVMRDAAGQRAAELDLWSSSATTRGHGYGPVAVSLMCAVLEEELGVEVAFLQPSARNPSAIRAYVAAGFRSSPLSGHEAAAYFGVSPDANDAHFMTRALSGQTHLARAPGDLDRAMVMPAFLEADDSEQSVLTYRDRGELWVLFSGTRTPVVRGHVLVLPSSSPDRVELVNLAISDNLRGRGMGSRMLTELMARLREQGVKEVCLSTATADTDALHFYQRLGFRFSSVERDVFTGERGYPGGLAVRGVPVLDRIWLDRSL